MTSFVYSKNKTKSSNTTNSIGKKKEVSVKETVKASKDGKDSQHSEQKTCKNKEKKKNNVNSLFEEEIVDGFAIFTFLSYNDLEVSLFNF